MKSFPKEVFQGIPPECILTDLYNTDEENNVHNYLKIQREYSFGSRKSAIHSEIIDIRKPAKTILCAYSMSPRLLVPLRNKNGYFLRPLNISELLQIQGLPSDYSLAGSIKKQIIQIGNAIPPPMITFIMNSIKDQL